MKVMFFETFFYEATPKAGSRENCKRLLRLPAVTARNSPVYVPAKAGIEMQTSP